MKNKKQMQYKCTPVKISNFLNLRDRRMVEPGPKRLLSVTFKNINRNVSFDMLNQVYYSWFKLCDITSVGCNITSFEQRMFYKT